MEFRMIAPRTTRHAIPSHRESTSDVRPCPFFIPYSLFSIRHSQVTKGDWLRRPNNGVLTSTLSGDGACPLLRRTLEKGTGTVAGTFLRTSQRFAPRSLSPFPANIAL